MKSQIKKKTQISLSLSHLNRFAVRTTSILCEYTSSLFIFRILGLSVLFFSDNMLLRNFTVNRKETNMLITGRAFPSVSDINPEIGTDLTQVTWAHAVDNRKKLRRALRGKQL